MKNSFVLFPPLQKGSGGLLERRWLKIPSALLLDLSKRSSYDYSKVTNLTPEIICDYFLEKITTGELNSYCDKIPIYLSKKISEDSNLIELSYEIEVSVYRKMSSIFSAFSSEDYITFYKDWFSYTGGINITFIPAKIDYLICKNIFLNQVVLWASFNEETLLNSLEGLERKNKLPLDDYLCRVFGKFYKIE